MQNSQCTDPAAPAMMLWFALSRVKHSTSAMMGTEQLSVSSIDKVSARGTGSALVDELPLCIAINSGVRE